MGIGNFVKKLMNPEYAIGLMLGFIFLGVGIALIGPLFLSNGIVANVLDKVFSDANVTSATALGTATSATLKGLVFIVFPLAVIAGVVAILLSGKK